MLTTILDSASRAAVLPPTMAVPAGALPAAAPPTAALSACRNCLVRDRTICSALTVADLPVMAAIATRLEFEAGDRILSEGEPADHLFNITRGTVKVFRELADGRRQITGFLFAGDFLGLALNDGSAYSAEAVGRVLACRLPRPRFEATVDRFPELKHSLLRRASSELVAAQDQMLLLGRKTAREKLASFLAMIARRMPPAECRNHRIDLAMTRADIADYLGLTIETVSRTFTQFRQSGLLALHGPAQIEILRPDLMAATASGA